MQETYKGLKKRAVAFVNRFTLRSILISGFALVISLGLIIVFITEWATSHANDSMDRFMNVDMPISNLCLKSNALMISARRHEKDFLLNYREYGFNEAKSRYIMRVLTSVADIKENMKTVRLLSGSPEIARQTLEVERAIDQYQSGLLIVVGKLGTLGWVDTGLEGELRAAAHEIEGILRRRGKESLLIDLLSMRRREKDFFARSRDIDVILFREAVGGFRADLSESGLPPAQTLKIKRLMEIYVKSFENYAATTEEIRAGKKGYLDSVQTVEATLGRLYADSIDRANATNSGIKKTERILRPVKIMAGLSILLCSISAAFAVSAVISKSMGNLIFFAGRVTSGDLTSRLTPEGRNEFAALSIALNDMVASLERADEDRKEWTAELLRSEQRFRTIFENANDGILLSDPETGKFTDGNETILRMLGYGLDEIRDLGVLDIYSEKSLPHVIEQFEKQARRETALAKDLQVKRKDGSAFYADVNTSYVKLGGKTYAMGIFRDITERKQSETQIRFLAYYDGLTGLPNRTFFKEILSRSIAYAGRYDTPIALLYFDVDDFKRINDTLGHDVGDALLRAVAERISGVVRRSDNVARLSEGDAVVSRLGGDEFVALLYNIDKVHDAGKAARRMLDEIAKPYTLGGHEVFITASMGICLYPSCGESIENLLKNADAAMYHAKAKGKNNYQFYSEAMNATALEMFNLERDLRRAVERNEFVLYYQPKLDASSKNITGMEALIRWMHGEKGMISPVQFIPLAEDTGLIIPIGEWTLLAACSQTRAWREAGFKDLVVSVNLSARQFGQKNLVGAVQRALNAAGLPPRYLELEITESTVMKNPEEAIAILNEFKTMGVWISVDDFGTAYSSLNYLRKLPIDFLKIDRSFVMHVTENPADAAIVKGIISLAHSLKLKVIAEGVETEEQFEFLRSVDCDEVQGFLFSKPLPVEAFSKLLSNG